MEIGILAGNCRCTTHCEKGVEPMGDCVCKLPGETVTARCEVCAGTTWHNNGSCISCVRKTREEAKQRAALRHQQILAAPANPVQIKDDELVIEADYRTPVNTVPKPAGKAPMMEIVLRVMGNDIVLASNLEDVLNLLRHAPRH